MEPIRLLIVDDHRLFRQGLASLLRNEPEFVLVGEAASGEEALAVAAATGPDVVLVDLTMPIMTGTELITQLLARWPELQVVVLTASEDDADLISALQAGARGYALKSTSAESLFEVIRQVRAGGIALCAMSAPKMLEFLRSVPTPRLVDVSLTAREHEVMALILAGADNAKIASQLVIAETTVKTHVAHLLEKLGLHSRSDLIAWAHGGRVKY